MVMETIRRIVSIVSLSVAAVLSVAGEGEERMFMSVFDELTYTPARSVFKVNAPGAAQSVTLRVYGDAASVEPLRTVPMSLVGANAWGATVEGDLKGMFYTFQLCDTCGMTRAETPGVFAKAVGVNGKRAAVIDLDATDPEGWDDDARPPLSSPADLIIYEMHHRDFSIHPSSGIVNKGKFLALTEPQATAWLTDLGVNAVHLLPSFDYASIDETRLSEQQYNWGYDPVNYNVPDGSYSTDPYDPAARITEFKMMVQALHRAGIRVILDVVYNHTYDIDNSNFQLTWPDYYYRKRADGTYSDGSGCGNETASERPLMRQFMVESVLYWMDEYHVDGFRFDLMGVHDIATMNAIRAAVDAVDSTVYIYGEGWSAGVCAYPSEERAVKANMSRLPRVGAFGDELRDALRGPFDDDSQGAFLAGLPGSAESVKYGIVGAIAHPQVDMTKVNYSSTAWAAEPTQMVAYVSCHDDMCLVDRLRASVPDINDDELVRLDLLAQTAVFTSQGVPFMLSGEELLRDKDGVHNSYNAPDGVNAIDWTHRDRYPQVVDYYRGLIRMRRNHPAFRMGTAAAVSASLSFLDTGSESVVAFRIDGAVTGDDWTDIIVILNAAKQPMTVAIPSGTYTVVCRDGVINEHGIISVDGGAAEAPPQSALILIKR